MCYLPGSVSRKQIERLKQQKVNVEIKGSRKIEPQLSWIRRVLLKNGKDLSIKKRSIDFERGKSDYTIF